MIVYKMDVLEALKKAGYSTSAARSRAGPRSFLTNKKNPVCKAAPHIMLVLINSEQFLS